MPENLSSTGGSQHHCCSLPCHSRCFPNWLPGSLQVDRSEVEGPDAQAQIARLVTQQGPQAEPTASALAEHDAAFPAIGQGLKADGIPKTVPRDSASVAATTGDRGCQMPAA